MEEIKRQIEELYIKALKTPPKINRSKEMFGAVKDKLDNIVASTKQIENLNEKAIELANYYLENNGNKEEEKETLIVFLREMITKYSKQFILR